MFLFECLKTFLVFCLYVFGRFYLNSDLSIPDNDINFFLVISVPFLAKIH